MTSRGLTGRKESGLEQDVVWEVQGRRLDVVPCAERWMKNVPQTRPHVLPDEVICPVPGYALHIYCDPKPLSVCIHGCVCWCRAILLWLSARTAALHSSARAWSWMSPGTCPIPSSLSTTTRWDTAAEIDLHCVEYTRPCLLRLSASVMMGMVVGQGQRRGSKHMLTWVHASTMLLRRLQLASPRLSAIACPSPRTSPCPLLRPTDMEIGVTAADLLCRH